jgi:hypothetical protein
VRAGRRSGDLFIGGRVHGGEQGVPRCPFRRIRGVAHSNRRARASPAGNTAGGRGPADGSTARPQGFGVRPEGDVLGGRVGTAS